MVNQRLHFLTIMGQTRVVLSKEETLELKERRRAQKLDWAQKQRKPLPHNLQPPHWPFQLVEKLRIPPG